jgi:hypothetical protein
MRFVHLDKFYELEYSKIALRITHNMIQTESIKADQAKPQNSKVAVNKVIDHLTHFTIQPSINEISTFMSNL